MIHRINHFVIHLYPTKLTFKAGAIETLVAPAVVVAVQSL